MRKWDGLRDESGKSFSPTELYEVGRRDKSSTFVPFPLIFHIESGFMS